MPVQVTGEVVTVKKIGAYTAMTVTAPGIPELTRPGHFVGVQVGGAESSMLLRRAFALYDVQPRGVYGGTVQFVFAVHGKGTAWLAERRPQDRLDLVGPLGKPFRLPAHPVNATLVGKHSQGRGDDVVPLILAGEVDLVLNTPFGIGTRRDGYEIRTAAVQAGVPCITTIQGAAACVQGIEAMVRGDIGVCSLQDHHARLGGARTGGAC